MASGEVAVIQSTLESTSLPTVNLLADDCMSLLGDCEEVGDSSQSTASSAGPPVLETEPPVLKREISRQRSRLNPLRQLKEGLEASGGSSGSLKNLSKQAKYEAARARLPKEFLMMTSLQPAGCIWRRRMKQDGTSQACSDFTSSVSDLISEEQSTCDKSCDYDFDCGDQLEKSVDAELEACELFQAADETQNRAEEEIEEKRAEGSTSTSPADSVGSTWVVSLHRLVSWSSDGELKG